MIQIKYISLITIFIYFISGCKNNNDTIQPNIPDDPFTTLPTDSVIVPAAPIASNIIFSVLEDIAPSGRTFSIIFYTEDAFSGTGYRIGSKLECPRSGQIEIYLHKIDSCQICAHVPSPAYAEFDLGTLSNGLYSLTIFLNGKSIESLMLLSDSSLITKVQPNNMLRISRNVLLRVPQNIIWGESESIEPTNYYQIFLDSLEIVGAKEAYLAAGDYRYFTVNSDGSFDLHIMLDCPGKFFLYQFDPDPSVSRDLIKRFAKRYLDTLYVKLWGGRGEEYSTTVLRWEP